MSPDSNISPASYVSPMCSPVYNGNEFAQQSFLNKTVKRNSSFSTNYLPNEPSGSLDLIDLLDDYLNNSKSNNEYLQDNTCEGPGEPYIAVNPTHQNCQFYAEPSNSVDPQVLQLTNEKITQEMPHNNSVAPHIEPDPHMVNQNLPLEVSCNSITSHIIQDVNSKLSLEECHTSTSIPCLNVCTLGDQPLSYACNVTENQFNLIPPIIVRASPPKHLFADLRPTNYVQSNVTGYKTAYIPSKPNNQIPLNIPVENTVFPFTCRRSILPMHARKPDNSVNSFIYGNSAKKNLSKSVTLNPTTRFIATASSVQFAERQILPAGSEVYESGMSVPAVVRLKSLMKNMDFTVQYVKVCHDLANKPELLKE